MIVRFFYQSAYIGLVKNIRNKAFSQIKYNVDKIHISKKKSKEVSWMKTYCQKNSNEIVNQAIDN